MFDSRTFNLYACEKYLANDWSVSFPFLNGEVGKQAIISIFIFSLVFFCLTAAKFMNNSRAQVVIESKKSRKKNLNIFFEMPYHPAKSYVREILSCYHYRII